MEMEDNNSSISETQIDVHAEKDCTCIKDNTNNIEEHNLTLDKGILHSIDKSNGRMTSASFQGTIDEGLGDSFVKNDLFNSEKADGRRKRRKCRVACYRGKRTKSANTSKKTEIDECAMMLKPPGSSLPMKSSPVSCILTMTPETMQKEVEEFKSPDSGIATSCPWSNSLEITPSSGFESCAEYGKTPSATKRGNATEVEETDLKKIIDEPTKVDLVRNLQRNYIKIKSEIDPLSGLADDLFQEDIIGEEDYEKIRSARDMTKRSVDLLLKAVAYNITPLKLKKFIYFLRKCNYDYIADLLQNNSIQNLNRYSDLSQVNNFKNLQRKFGKLKKLLLKDFDPKYVIDELLEKEVISFIDHEDIWTTQFNEQRIDCVLKCVKRNIEINLGPFCCILRKHSEWLAEKIDLLSNDPESSDDSDANAVTVPVLELSCKKGNWTGSIEGPFKSIPDFNIRIKFKTEKIQNVDDDVVRRQGDSTNLSLDVTLSKLHCKCDRVDKGSIIVHLQPHSIRALQKLKDSKPEDVMAIVKCLLTNEDLKKLEAAKLTSVEIKIEALDSTLPNPISLKEEGISKEAIVEHFTYLSTCVPNIKEFIPAFLQDVQISDKSKAFLKEILSMKREDRNEAFLRFLLQEETGRPLIIFKRQLRKMKEISLLQKLGNRNEIEELGKDEIQMNYSYLLDELDSREFLKIFSEKGLFQEEICDKILRSRNRRERTKVFIDIVLESKKDVRDLFFQELEYKHQTIYYVLISTKQASKPSAESLSTLGAMKAAICERYDEVIGETEPKAYRDAFVERKIFTDQEFQELVKICPKENRAAAFLKKLLNGNNVFALKTFLWVLKRTGNESLANGLENDFYMFDGEEVNSPDIDGTNKCTLMTAALEAQIIIGKESQNNCSEDGYNLLEYPLECNPTELVDHTDQKVITCMQFSEVEKIKPALCGRRNCLPSPETSPKKTISQDEEDTGAHPISSEYDMLPPEILNMDERFQKLFTEALAAKKEKFYNIRIMVVGQTGMGKSSLIQRLLGEQVKENETESTEGIDVHTRCCQIDHVTKTWTRTIKTGDGTYKCDTCSVQLSTKLSPVPSDILKNHHQLCRRQYKNRPYEMHFHLPQEQMLPKTPEHAVMLFAKDEYGHSHVLHGPVIFPEYAAYDKRFSSFLMMPSSVPKTPMELASAGFYFFREPDQVACFSCGFGFRNWKPDDDPCKEHARQSPNCTFVKQVLHLQSVQQQPINGSSTTNQVRTLATTGTSTSFQPGTLATNGSSASIMTENLATNGSIDNWQQLPIDSISHDVLSFNDQRIVSILKKYVKPTELIKVMMLDPVNAISPVINSEPSPHDLLEELPITVDETMQIIDEFSQCDDSGFIAEESCDVPISYIAHVNNKIKRNTWAAEIQTFFKRAKSLPVPKSGLSDVTLLDFDDQSIFSTIHQAYMSWRTLYLFVIDMSLQLTDAVEEGACIIDVSGKKTCSIQEHVKFWLNSIHSHVCIPQDELMQREEKKNKWGECGAPVQGSNENHPCVILVATHADKIPKESLEKRKKAFFNAIRNVLNSHLLLHIADEEFAISNLGSDPSIDALKSKIFDVAQNWGVEIPARWIPLTKALIEIRNRGIKVMDYDDVKSLNETLQVRIQKSEELDLFLRFEHDIGNIVFFNNEKLKKKVLLDPEWLIHGVKIWITSDQVIKRNPELSEQYCTFKKTGRLTNALIEHIWAPHSEIIQNKEYILDLMEKLNIITKPLHKEEVSEEYYWVPCMVSTPAPDDVKKLQQNKGTTQTSTLCFRSKTKFIHVGVFQRLLAKCLSKWKLAKEGNLLFRDICVFDLDAQHQLVLSLNDFVIQATVIRFTHQGQIPDLQLCMTIRNDLYNALSKISNCLYPGSELEICIKCKESSALTNEGLHSISTLRTNDELQCSTHKEFHCVKSRELLRFWEEDNYREIPVNVLPKNLARAAERFIRLSSLVIDVGTKVLRKVLLLHYSGTSLDQYMKNNKRNILKLKSQKVLTQDQVDIIFPQSGETDPDQYDITIASALLSNIYPSLGKLEKQIIADLRTQRNNLAHYPSTRMSEQDFKAKWTRVTSTLTDLSNLCKDHNFQNDIQKEIKDIQQTGPFAVLSRLPEITKELKLHI